MRGRSEWFGEGDGLTAPKVRAKIYEVIKQLQRGEEPLGDEIVGEQSDKFKRMVARVKPKLKKRLREERESDTEEEAESDADFVLKGYGGAYAGNVQKAAELCSESSSESEDTDSESDTKEYLRKKLQLRRKALKVRLTMRRLKMFCAGENCACRFTREELAKDISPDGVCTACKHKIFMHP